MPWALNGQAHFAHFDISLTPAAIPSLPQGGAEHRTPIPENT
jgi:hypothetical protein